MKSLSLEKSVGNIRAAAYAEGGVFIVDCEIVGCPEQAPSSKLHGWAQQPYRCPNHVEKDAADAGA